MEERRSARRSLHSSIAHSVRHLIGHLVFPILVPYTHHKFTLARNVDRGFIVYACVEGLRVNLRVVCRNRDLQR